MTRPPADEWSPMPHEDDGLGDDPQHEEFAHEGFLHDEAQYDEFPHEDGEYDDVNLADDVLIGPEDHHHRRRRSPVVRWLVLLSVLAALGVGGYLGLSALGNALPQFSFGSEAPADYTGSGTGEVTVVIPAGAGGTQIGAILAEDDVVASAEAFANAAAADPRSTSIQPGTYTMASQMSASAALERLIDRGFRQVNGVTVREGLWKEEVWKILAKQTDTPLADYKAVDPAELDLPKAADGDMEGFLFPDTYDFATNASAKEQLQAMVDVGKRRYAQLDLEDGKELRRAVIIGSLVQAEGYGAEDLPKIARVVENRLASGEALAFDSTVHYMFKERGRAGTTDKQRHTEDPYNTYLNPGLPPGPINSPGMAAIEAAVDPAPGKWKYFVTVNPSTGETKFADTYAEHQKNERQFLDWCADHRASC